MRISYVALTRSDEMITGAIDAGSTAEALSQLRSQGLTPIDVRAGFSLPFGRRVKSTEAAQLMQRLATVVSQGGAPLTEVLPSLVEEEEQPNLRSVLVGIRDAILDDSVPMSKALARFPEVFPDVVVRRVAAGEKAGDLGQALQDGSAFLQGAVRTNARFWGALSYPMVLISIAIGIISMLSVTVMPKYAELYRELHAHIPLPTAIVLGFGQALIHGWFILIPGTPAAVWGTRRLLARRDVRDRLDYWLWNVPGWKRVVRGLAWARFAHVLSILYTEGTPILEAIQVACDASGSAVIRDVAPLLLSGIGERGMLKDAMTQARVFPPMMRTQVGLGEKHGTMPEMLKDTAQWYSREVDQILETLPNKLQPIMIVIVGALIGGMIVSLYLPIFGLPGLISAGIH